MLRKIFAAAVLLAGVSAQASADGYFGVSYTRVRLEGAEPTALDFKLGFQMQETLSAEIRAGLPVQGDSAVAGNTGVDFEAKYLGGFGRYGVFSGRGGVYGLIGFMETTVEVSAGGQSQEDSKSDLVLGVGAEFGADQGFAVEYLAGMRDLEQISWLNLGYFNKF